MDAQRITVAMVDRSAGHEARPERVRLADLARFADDVQVFLRGEAREVDTQSLDVAVRAGSFAIETALIAAAPRLFQDLQALLRSDKQLLRDDTVNRLYKSAVLRVKADDYVLTRQLRNVRLLAFVEYTTAVD